jgi:N-methylhydantoinase B
VTTTVGQPSGSRATIDPVTFEVIRHRLWAINDDQARMAARLSGSPIIFEGYDFNAALTTADGRSLYTGVYILHHGATLDEVVRHVLEMWDAEDIREGDMFFTNDPWLGALHANDGVLVMPLFADGDLVGWSGIVTHDSDVGSPAPGSFVVGARDRFGEAPLIPAVRMVRDFELVGDVERMYLRNTRTPGSNALNMRARVAALRMTHDRIRDLVARYGKEVFLAAQEGILAYVERVLRSRLEQIPDGTWSAKGYLDHDGITPAIHPICCRVTKQGDHLIFDMAGSAPQVVGPVNCARPAMVGAVLGVVLVSLCYDLPWAVGALRNVVEVVAGEGTINNAVSPAAVSMASVMATLTTMDVASTAMAKMLMSSDGFRQEAQANWSPGIHAGLFLALEPQAPPAVSSMTDPFGGGGGARSDGDGVDTGGIPHSMASRIANVEVVESRAPQLIIFRRELVDSGGPGRFRGGVALISAAVSHKARHGAQHQTTASGVAVPAGRGLSGGLPGSGVYTAIVRDSDLRRTFAAGRVPVSAAE